jgi:hypothetical protein
MIPFLNLDRHNTLCILTLWGYSLSGVALGILWLPRIEGIAWPIAGPVIILCAMLTLLGWIVYLKEGNSPATRILSALPLAVVLSAAYFENASLGFLCLFYGPLGTLLWCLLEALRTALSLRSEGASS